MRAVLTLLLGMAVLGAQDKAVKPKVLLYYDMEGVTGIDRVEQTMASKPDYKAARQLLTDDVNAAIRGLAAGGAGSITVVDAHGSGNRNEPDILLDQLDPRARMEFRDKEFDPYVDVPDTTYQAIACVGMHARAGTPGFLSHSFTMEPSFRVNGQEINETEMIAHSAARFGIPVIMVSGDDVLGREIRDRIAGAEYVVVKKAAGRRAAELLRPEQTRIEIENAARRAMSRFNEIAPLAAKPEYTFEMKFQNRAQADIAAQYPGLTRVNAQTVGYTASDFPEGFRRARVLIRMAWFDRPSLLFQVVRARPDGAQILAEYERLLFTRWLEPEKLPARPAPPTTPPPAAPRRYHGAP